MRTTLLLDRLPTAIRAPLWRIKHATLAWFASRGLSEYRQHLLGTVLRREGIQTVLDVGANTGQYARGLRRMGYGGRIISFEPATVNVQVLTRLSRGDAAWEVRQLALGADRGSLPLSISRESEFSSLLRPSRFGFERFGKALAPVTTENVSVERLDDLWGELVPDRTTAVHLKVDTQGFEASVLLGAEMALSRVRTIEIELSMRAIYEGEWEWTRMADHLRARGFVLAGLYPVSREPNWSVIEADGVFVRSAS